MIFLEYGKTDLYPSIRIQSLNVILKSQFDPKVKYTGLFIFAIKQNDFWYNGVQAMVLISLVSDYAEFYAELIKIRNR